MMQKAGRALGLFIVLALAAGCGSSEIQKSPISGKVTFKGKPVPAGYVSFQPDKGEVIVLQINDGVYDSAKEQKPGVIPGPNKIRIAGFDGVKVKGFSQGKQIFNPYSVQETIASSTSTKDFVVPPSAGDNLKIEPTSDEP